MVKDARLCEYPFCKRKKRKGKDGKKKGRYCTTCDKKVWRKNNPMKAVFQTLRQNARRRGKVFTLTFEQFQKFCRETRYMRGRGREQKSYTIDREKNELGYTADNIRMLPKGENSRKGTKTLIYDYRYPELTTVV